MSQIRIIVEDSERVDIGAHDTPTYDPSFNGFDSSANPNRLPSPYSEGARLRVVRTPAVEPRALRGQVVRVRERFSCVRDGEVTWQYFVQPVDCESMPPATSGLMMTEWDSEDLPAALIRVSKQLYALYHTELAPAPLGSELPELRDPDEDELFIEAVDRYQQRAINWRGRQARAWGTTYAGFARLKETTPDGYGRWFTGNQVVVVSEPHSERFLLRQYEYPRPSEDERFRHTWGYNGTGPRQLALAILCDVLGEALTEPQYRANASLALAMRHDFKEEVIAHLPTNGARNEPSWVLSADLVGHWINGWIVTHRRDLYRWAERMVEFDEAEERRHAAEVAETNAAIDAELDELGKTNDKTNS